MKKILLAATAMVMIVPDIALAQQNMPARPPGATRPAPPQPNVRPVRPGGPQVQPARPEPPRPPRPGTGGPQIQPPRPPRPQPPRPGIGGPQIQPPRPGRPQPPRPVRPVRPLPPHRPGAGRPPHFRPIRGPAFYYPRGYRYRRWVTGVLLPTLFLSSRYYYTNYAPLGVGAPPRGYRWVRYGPDLLLVNKRTRRIADVIYGAFY